MNTSAEAAEQVVRMSLNGAEAALKITGSASKEVAKLLFKALKDLSKQTKKTKGQMRLSNLVKSGKKLEIYQVADANLKRFCEQAKKYGMIYTVLKDRNKNDGITEVTLNSEKITVRIRQQHSDMKLQIKKHREFNNGLSTSDEYSGKIDILPSVMKIPDISDNVILKGVLVTERQIFSFGRNSSICFDGNMYLGICDYEVEIEVDERDTEDALSIINYLGLIQKPIKSKSERFFRRLEAMKSE